MAINNGGDDYIQKAFDSNVLIVKIDFIRIPQRILDSTNHKKQLHNQFMVKYLLLIRDNKGIYLQSTQFIQGVCILFLLPLMHRQ